MHACVHAGTLARLPIRTHTHIYLFIFLKSHKGVTAMCNLKKLNKYNQSPLYPQLPPSHTANSPFPHTCMYKSLESTDSHYLWSAFNQHYVVHIHSRYIYTRIIAEKLRKYKFPKVSDSKEGGYRNTCSSNFIPISSHKVRKSKCMPTPYV